MSRRAAVLLFTALLCSGHAAAEEDLLPAARYTEEREVCSAHDPQRRPFFGDTHVHTTYSQDASTQGTRAKPRDVQNTVSGLSTGETLDVGPP